MTVAPRSRTEVGVPLVACLVASALGCQDYLFEEKRPQGVKEAQIQKPGITRTPADILFVVDNSGSMADEQENLARNFDQFINEVAGAGDYQIAVVSTDLDTSGGERSGLFETTFNPNPPYNALDFDNSACMSTGTPHGCFRSATEATRVINSSQLPSREAQISAFQANVKLGSCGSGKEQGLKSMITALENTKSGCNAGFLRPNANLVVVIVSDEEDTDDTPIQDYVNRLIALKPASQVRVAMVVGAVDGQAANCRIPNTATCGSFCQRMPAMGSHTACTTSNQCPAREYCDSIQHRCENLELQNWSTENCLWCSYYNASDCCSALGGSRYVSFAQAIEARVADVDSSIPIQGCRGTEQNAPIACLIDSICQDNFGATLARIARELVVNSTFTLDPPAVYPEGVVVRVNGKDLKYGEDYEVIDEGKTVRIKGSAVPRENEKVEVYYVIENK